MTPASVYLRVRAESVAAQAKTYELQAANTGNCDIERDAYNIAALKCCDIEQAFLTAAAQIEERAGLRLPFRRVVPAVPASQSETV